MRRRIPLDRGDPGHPALVHLDSGRSRHRWWPLWMGAALGVALALLLREFPDAEDGPDLVALQDRVLSLAGDARVDVRHLGDGIVELVGEVEAPPVATRLVDALNGEPGVSVVLDRLWVRPPRLVS